MKWDSLQPLSADPQSSHCDLVSPRFSFPTLPPHGLVNVFWAYDSVSERTIWLMGTLNLLIRNPK